MNGNRFELLFVLMPVLLMLTASAGQPASGAEAKKQPTGYYQRNPTPVDFRGMPVIVEKETRTMCKGFEKLLNSKGPYKKPLFCELYTDELFDPVKFPDFKRPDWERLDPRKHEALVRELDYLQSHPTPEYRHRLDEETWRKAFEARMKDGRLAIYKTTVNRDLDGDRDKPDVLIRYEVDANQCKGFDDLKYPNRYIYYFSADEDLNKLEALNELGAEMYHDVFLYRGIPSFYKPAQWWDSIRVTVGAFPSECEFVYRNKPKTKQRSMQP